MEDNDSKGTAGEEIVFCVSVHDDKIVSKKQIMKQILHLIKVRKNHHLRSDYGVVLFDECHNPVFLTRLTEDVHEIEHLLKDEGELTCDEHPLDHGIMVGLHYLIDAFKTSGNRLYRMILVTDVYRHGITSIEKGMLDLLEIVRFFPLSVDIIRLGKESYTDQHRLQLISLTTHGRLIYAEDAKVFKKAFDRIVESNDATPASVFNEGIPGVAPPSTIPEAYKSFFEEIATLVDEIRIHGDGKDYHCGLCRNSIVPDPKSLSFVCPGCNTSFHEQCFIDFFAQHNVGFIHVGRCFECDLLLQIDEDKIRNAFDLPLPDDVLDSHNEEQ